MHGAQVRAIVLSLVMVSGLLIGSMGVDGAFATKEDNNGSEQGKKTAKGCEKSNENSKSCTQNPNSGTSTGGICPTADDPDDCDGDGVSNQDEIDSGCLDPFNPDSDGDENPDGSDGGAHLDGAEFSLFTNPCDPNSHH